jgi:hypothetical protein
VIVLLEEIVLPEEILEVEKKVEEDEGLGTKEFLLLPVYKIIVGILVPNLYIIYFIVNTVVALKIDMVIVIVKNLKLIVTKVNIQMILFNKLYIIIITLDKQDLLDLWEI